MRARFDRAETPAELLPAGRRARPGGAAPGQWAARRRLATRLQGGRAGPRAVHPGDPRLSLLLLLRAAKDAAQAGARLQYCSSRFRQPSWPRCPGSGSPSASRAPGRRRCATTTRSFALGAAQGRPRLPHSPARCVSSRLARPTRRCSSARLRRRWTTRRAPGGWSCACCATRRRPRSSARATHGPVHILHCAAPVALTERGAPRLLLRREGEPLDLSGLLADARGLRLVTSRRPAGRRKLDWRGRAHAGDDAALGRAARDYCVLRRPARPAVGPLRRGVLRPACRGTAPGRPGGDGRPPRAGGGWRRAGMGIAQLRLLPGGEQLFAFRAPLRRAPARLPRSLYSWPGRRCARGRGRLWARAGDSGVGARAAPVAGAGPARTRAGAGDTAAAGRRPGDGIALRAAAGAARHANRGAIRHAGPAGRAGRYPGAHRLRYLPDTAGRHARRHRLAHGSEPAAIATLNMLDPRAPLRADRPLVIPVYRPGEAGAGGL